MRSSLKIQKHDNARSKVEISIDLSTDELEVLEGKACPRHCDSPKPPPCVFYQSYDPRVGAVQGLPLHNGNPVKAYILPNARKVPLNRPMPGRTLLRLTFPGLTTLGFVDEQHIPRLEIWWGETEKSLREQIKNRLFELENETVLIAMPGQTTEKVVETNLNPFAANEINGVRKRAFDDF